MKLGSFVGKKDVKIDQYYVAKAFFTIASNATNIFSIKKEDIKDSYKDGLSYKIEISVNLPSMRKLNGDTVSKITKLSIRIYNQEGYLERANGNNQTGIRQFCAYCDTDGVYHNYKQHHKNDYRYEGKDHFVYNTDIVDLCNEIGVWMENVKKCRAN